MTPKAVRPMPRPRSSARPPRRWPCSRPNSPASLPPGRHIGSVRPRSSPARRSPPGQHHGPPQLVQPGPGGLVAAEAEGACGPRRSPPFFSLVHGPHRQGPCPQRLAGPLRTSSQRSARGLPCVTAASTPPFPAAGRRLHGVGGEGPSASESWRSRRRQAAWPQRASAGPAPGRCSLVVNARHQILTTSIRPQYQPEAGGEGDTPWGEVERESSSASP